MRVHYVHFTNQILVLYIVKSTSQNLNKKVATVFVLIDSPSMDIIAYYTLSTYTVDITNLDKTFTKGLPRYPLLPAILLGRLAVDSSRQSQGLGGVILIDALKRVLRATEQVASSVAVIVEAIDEKAVNFYQKYGFQQFKEHSFKLYLPVKAIEELCLSFEI
ncbi:GNAT family N-acetyltransferase [Nostoc sp.]